jgi:hypothetical protein
MTENVIVLSVSQYKIVNDTTGELENEGCTVRYLLGDDLSPYTDKVRPVKGLVPAKATMPFDAFDKFEIVPALYEAELDFAVDSKGAAKITATGFKFISALGVTRTTGKPA